MGNAQPVVAACERPRKASNSPAGTALSTAHQASAINILADGPASATKIIARRGLRSALVATGTAFAQPNSGAPTASSSTGTNTVPMGSM